MTKMRVIFSWWFIITTAIQPTLSRELVWSALPKVWFINDQVPESICSVEEYEVITKSLKKDLVYKGGFSVLLTLIDKYFGNGNRNLLRGHQNERELGWGCSDICSGSSYLCNWVCPYRRYRRVLGSDDESDDESDEESNNGGSTSESNSSSSSAAGSQLETESSLESMVLNLCMEVIAREAPGLSTACGQALLGATCYSSVYIEDI